MKRPVLVVACLVIAVLALFTTGCAKELTPAQEQKGLEAQEVAEKISRDLKGRFGDLHEIIIKKGNRENPEYREFQKTLAEYVESSGVTYLYTLIQVSDDMTNLIVDATEDEEADDYGTEYEMDEQMASAFEGKPDFSRELWKDEDYGLQISAFAPLYNSAGEIVAVIGVDAPL